MRFAPAAILMLSLTAPAGAAPTVSQPWLSQPGISPDGREIAFSSGGDLWTVPATGGEARLLVSHPADDRRPLYSPDGRDLAFVSTRTGNGDVYVLTLATGALRRLTFDDGLESLDAWSPDGRWIWFSSTTADVAGMNDLWRVPAAGGTPMPASNERYTQEFGAAPSPDGKSLLFCARGIALAQWWRRGHSHLDESEVWLRGETGEPRRILDRGAKSLWPMWRPDAAGFWFVSDRGGAENLWTSDLAGSARPLTRFTGGRLLWPTVSRDGKTIAFERDFGLWTLDPSGSEPRRLAVTLRGAPAAAAPEHRKITTGFSSLAASPDGRKIAFVARGEVFAASATDGGNAARVTRTVGVEDHVAWSPDSRRLAFTTAEDGASHLGLYDFVTGTTTVLTRGRGVDVRPTFSPDSSRLAFVRDGGQVVVLDLATRQERVVATARIDLDPPFTSARPIAWSPDSRWVAFLASGDRGFRNAGVVDTRTPGATPVAVSFLANTNANSIGFSADGRSLFFDTNQRSESGDAARVDLVPRAPKFQESKFRDLFADDKGGKGAGKGGNPAAVEVLAAGLRQRLTLLPAGVDVQEVAPSPDGKQLLLVAGAEGSTNLYLWSLDELAADPPVARQLTSTRGTKRHPQFSADGKTVFFLEDGAIKSVGVDSREVKGVSVTAELDVDFDGEKQVVFDQAWGWLRTHFHDAKMNGVDWDAVRREWAPVVTGTRTPVELARLLSMMVGELNASHCGVNPPGEVARVTGRLGLRFDRAEYERSGALRVAGIVPLSPADLSRQVAVGDVLRAVDGAPLAAGTALEARLENKVGRQVTLTLAGAGGTPRDVALQPVNALAEKNLVYREWVEKNRALVAKASGGRLGYVHMFDMSEGSLRQLITDLDAENMTRDGVVVDVRNNNGGFVNVYALDILSRKHYLDMTDRGWPTVNARTNLGQRSLERPTALVTNQHSLSDAEDFSEGYRALGVGPIVGEPTAGWIIYTSNERMLDGSVVRLPVTGITTAKGEPMEMHPRPVDVEVRRALGEDAAGRDSQLERAVAELMKRLK